MAKDLSQESFFQRVDNCFGALQKCSQVMNVARATQRVESGLETVPAFNVHTLFSAQEKAAKAVIARGLWQAMDEAAKERVGADAAAIDEIYGYQTCQDGSLAGYIDAWLDMAYPTQCVVMGATSDCKSQAQEVSAEYTAAKERLGEAIKTALPAIINEALGIRQKAAD